MKQVITLVIAIIISLSTGLYEIKYIQNTSNYFNADLNHIKNKIELEDYKIAEKHLKELEKDWNNIKKIWDIFINHEDIDKIEEEILKCKVNIQEKEKTETIQAIENLKRNFKNIANRKKIKVQNII